MDCLLQTRLGQCQDWLGWTVETPAYNGPVSWKSYKQTTVSLSTTEAKYIACSEAAREAQWLAKLHTDIVGNLEPPLPIFTDSNGALENILAAGYRKSRNKHIDVKLHLCRNLHIS